MPLLDHFHPPTSRRPWESFHSLWCGAILDQLNDLLPSRYFGAVEVHLGTHVEAGVAEFDQVVTNRRANMHNALARLLHWPDALLLPEDNPLYANAYFPVRREEQNLIDTWQVPLCLGQVLPVVPLPVRGLGCLPLNLETGYTRARESSRL